MPAMQLQLIDSDSTAVLAQAHRRDIKDDGIHQGFGLLQVGSRHLLYIGSNEGRLHLCVGFLWFTRARP